MGQGHEGSFSTEAILWGCLLSPWGCPVRTAPFLDGLGPTGAQMSFKAYERYDENELMR